MENMTHSSKPYSGAELALIEGNIEPHRRHPFVLLETVIAVKKPETIPALRNDTRSERQTPKIPAKSKQEKIRCHHCSRKFSSQSGLFIHLETHKDTIPEPYLCTICTEAFDDSNELKYHLGTAHPDQHTIMVVKSSVRKAILLLAPRLKFECPYANCGKKFISKCYLDKHTPHHSKLKEHVCSTCGAKYAGRYRLQVHWRKGGCDEMLARKAAMKFSCHICDIPLATKKSLKNHNKRFHGLVPKIVKKSFVCNFCGHKAVGGHELARHTRIHTGERPYVCGGCGHGSRDNSNYRNHVRICKKAIEKGIFLQKRIKIEKEVEKPDADGNYHCSKCAYKNPKIKNKRDHERCHGNEVPCPHCPTEFKAKSGLIHHMMSEHPALYKRTSKPNIPVVKGVLAASKNCESSSVVKVEN